MSDSPCTADDPQTRERQYNRLWDVAERHGRTELGLMLNRAWHDGPKRLAFTFARYKFAAKMLSGRKNVVFHSFDFGIFLEFLGRTLQCARPS